jgi:serine/threonine protein kinase
VDPLVAFCQLIGEKCPLGTREKAFLWENEAELLKFAALGSLPKDQALKAYIRASSRIRTTTKINFQVRGFLIGKVLKSSQRDSAIWAASSGTKSLVAKVYTVEGKAGFLREVSAHKAIGAHPHIAQPVFVQDSEGKGQHAGVILFPRFMRSLSDLLSDDGTLSDDTVLAISNELIGAIAHTHSVKLVHCDLKPANVMLDHEGRAILIDLASAVKLGDEIVECTSHYALGLHHGKATFGLDLRCLSVTIFELLTGRIPLSLDQLLEELKQMEGRAPLLAIRCANARAIDEVKGEQYLHTDDQKGGAPATDE